MVRVRYAGFTYLGALWLVAALSGALAVTSEVWRTSLQRERERELLFVGDQFRRAIASYYLSTPGRVRHFPATLEELLRDPRHPGVVRHLRRLYRDPLTGGEDWGLIKGPDGRIRGVYSLAPGTPLKITGFGLKDVDFEGKQRYADWAFIYPPARVRLE